MSKLIELIIKYGPTLIQLGKIIYKIWKKSQEKVASVSSGLFHKLKKLLRIAQ